MAWPDQGSSDWKAKTFKALAPQLPSADCLPFAVTYQSFWCVRCWGRSVSLSPASGMLSAITHSPRAAHLEQANRPSFTYCLVVGFVSRSTQLDDRVLEDKDQVFASGTWWVLNGHQLQTSSPGSIPQLSPLKDPQEPWGHIYPCTCCAKLSCLFSCLFPGYLVGCTGRALS